MRPQYALPLVSALALVYPAQAITAAVTSASGTNGSTATATTTSPSSGQVTSGTGAGRTTGVRPIDQERLGIVGGETIGANGERIALETIASVQPAPVATTPTPELDAATRAAERKLRAKSARKQQLMHSIVPRTNVDRTDQMPDDPISPAVR